MSVLTYVRMDPAQVDEPIRLRNAAVPTSSRSTESSMRRRRCTMGAANRKASACHVVLLQYIYNLVNEVSGDVNGEVAF